MSQRGHIKKQINIESNVPWYLWGHIGAKIQERTVCNKEIEVRNAVRHIQSVADCLVDDDEELEGGAIPEIPTKSLDRLHEECDHWKPGAVLNYLKEWTQIQAPIKWPPLGEWCRMAWRRRTSALWCCINTLSSQVWTLWDKKQYLGLSLFTASICCLFEQSNTLWRPFQFPEMATKSTFSMSAYSAPNRILDLSQWHKAWWNYISFIK